MAKISKNLGYAVIILIGSLGFLVFRIYDLFFQNISRSHKTITQAAKESQTVTIGSPTRYEDYYTRAAYPQMPLPDNRINEPLREQYLNELKNENKISDNVYKKAKDNEEK